MHAPPKSDYPIITPDELQKYDGILFGIPTRYGNFPAQWKAFWDSTGGLWVKQSLAGKMFGTFISTGTPGGGPELTALQSLSVAVHQGMVYVPIGYQIGEITNLEEVHGGSPWVCDLIRYSLLYSLFLCFSRFWPFGLFVLRVGILVPSS